MIQEGEVESVGKEEVGEEDYMPSNKTGIPIILTLGRTF
jgi:hypothetical protein